jgi:hypothetical protein
MSNRLRTTEEVLSAVESVSAQISDLLGKATNVGWTHDHIGVLESTLSLLRQLREHLLSPSRNTAVMSLQRDLGRLTTDNGGIDYTPEIESALLRISTAHLRS